MEQFENGNYEEKMHRTSLRAEEVVQEIRQQHPEIVFSFLDLPNEFVIEVEGSGYETHITKVDPFVVLEAGRARPIPLEWAVRAAILHPEIRNTRDALRASGYLIE